MVQIRVECDRLLITRRDLSRCGGGGRHCGRRWGRSNFTRRDLLGLAAALAIGKLIKAQLYETSAYNPVLLTGTIAVLGTAALLACLFPARRATLVNPTQALRSE